MALFSPDGNRPLPPITERTTPGSFRTTIGLPVVDVVDYHSEREDGPPSPTHSVYSRQSSDTITQHRERPVDEIHDDLSVRWSGDNRHSLETNQQAPIRRSIPFPESTQSATILTTSRPIPVPAESGTIGRTTEGSMEEVGVRQRYMDRYFPKAEEDNEEPPSFNRASLKLDEGDGSGIAGVGANGPPLVVRARTRPSSFHAGTPTSSAPSPGEFAFLHPLLQSGDLPPHISSDLEQHPELHNFPFVREHHVENWSNPPSGTSSPVKLGARSPVRSPAASRPSSIKQRPHSFHGSQSKAARKAFQADVSAATSDEAVHEPSGLAISPATSERPSFTGQHSNTSLPRSASSASLTGGRIHRKQSPSRRRIVSSIFGSIFGSSLKETPDPAPRKLSRRRPLSHAEEKQISRLDSPISEVSPIGLAVAEPVTAIRTSGTFGIRDDGSELYAEGDDQRRLGSPESPRPHSIRNRTQSGSGSVHSLSAERVLFVKNVDTVLTEDEEQRAAQPPVPVSPIEEMLTEESGDTREVFYTPIDIDSPASSHHDLLVDTVRAASATSKGSALRPHRSLSPQTSHSPTFASAGQTLSRDPLTPPPTQPTPAEPVFGTWSPFTSRTTSTEYSRPNRGVQVSIMPTAAGVTGSPTRPLPFPPGSHSRLPSLVDPPQSDVQRSLPNRTLSGKNGKSRHIDPPMLNIPPPPSGSPSPNLSFGNQPDEAPQIGQGHSSSADHPASASDLPLLIASHLLSIHAAALMRHSATMRDVSEVMHQMAQESLEWGGILLGMSHSGEQQSPQARAGPWSSLNPFTQFTTNSRDLHIDGLPGRAYVLTSHPDDPLKQALEKLHGLDTASSASQFGRSVHAPPSAPPFTDSNPATSEESDRFTPIPQRPTASRKSSRNRLASERTTAKHIRPRHESLPADWLGEADRLGREGWESLRKAEEAWSSAMNSLKALAESSMTPITTEENFSWGNDPREDESTLKARHPTRSRHASLDMPFPRKMDRVDRTAVEQRSFLPTDLDMGDLSSEQVYTGDLDKASKILGPNVGIEQLRDSRARQAINPVFATLIRHEQEGYSDEHLGIENTTTMKDRPKSRTETSTVSTATANRTGGRKLSKKSRPKDAPPPIPSRFLAAHTSLPTSHRDIKGGGPVQVDQTRLQGTQKKKHWWSRSRAGSLVA